MKRTTSNIHLIKQQKKPEVECEEMEQRVPLMLTIDETAKKAGMSTYTVRTWIKKGVLPYILIGRKYLISWDNFCKFLNSDMSETRKMVR